MKIKHLLFVAYSIIANSSYSQSVTNKTTIPLGGNSWVTVKAKNGKEEVTNNGWKNWEHSEAVWSTYIKINTPGVLKISVALSVPEGESKIACSIEGESKTISVTGTDKKEYTVGEWEIVVAGYIKIDMKGITKTGNVFADVSELTVEGIAVNEQTAFVKNNDGNYFYWGRRGPSVHLNYDISNTGDDIEWFYNEITVPEGNDPVGSYFMANGFGEGYFGIQVNSPTERRILFSVWSPFKTDNPNEIPAEKKILMLKKGKDVYIGEFGNEGSGGQSYLKYNWKAGETYKFLLIAEPVENYYTTYTAYFYAAEQKQWLLIASFSRPATHTYLTRLHSFLENFDPSTGYITRKAWFHNQWVKTKAGEWKAITKVQFTGDATAGKGYRLDYGGGTEGDKFYLRNCGFFNDNTVLKTKFSHSTPAKMPEIKISDSQ